MANVEPTVSANKMSVARFDVMKDDNIPKVWKILTLSTVGKRCINSLLSAVDGSEI